MTRSITFVLTSISSLQDSLFYWESERPVLPELSTPWQNNIVAKQKGIVRGISNIAPEEIYM